MVINLEGNWARGKAFDLHTRSSTYLGIDQFGHDRFDNQRSEMGELVYQLKYKQNREAVAQIVSLLDNIGGIEKFDFLAPIPATNKNRPIQPVQEITIALGQRRAVAVLPDLLKNAGNEELKGVTDPVARHEMLAEAISVHEPGRVTGKKVLLVDDLYRSGSTLRVATDRLITEANPEAVCVLTMTKTRSNR